MWTINIRYVSQEQLEKWRDEFSLTSLTKRGIPENTIELPEIPYTYHEIYREILRRDEEESK
jgi:hypothetical protein